MSNWKNHFTDQVVQDAQNRFGVEINPTKIEDYFEVTDDDLKLDPSKPAYIVKTL